MHVAYVVPRSLPPACRLKIEKDTKQRLVGQKVRRPCTEEIEMHSATFPSSAQRLAQPASSLVRKFRSGSDRTSAAASRVCLALRTTPPNHRTRATGSRLEPPKLVHLTNASRRLRGAERSTPSVAPASQFFLLKLQGAVVVTTMPSAPSQFQNRRRRRSPLRNNIPISNWQRRRPHCTPSRSLLPRLPSQSQNDNAGDANLPNFKLRR